MEKRKFVGIFIPAEVLENKELTWTEKSVLAEIDALNINDNGCFASNSHFCKLFDVNNVTISRAINNLLRLNLITIENPGTRNRRMYPVTVTRKPYKKVYGNPIENDRVTLSKTIGSHHIYNEINKEGLSIAEKNDRERAFFEADLTDSQKDCNKLKSLFTIELKKQRLNNIVKAFTIESDFLETSCRRFSIDETELKKSLKKFLDTINADDSCYDDFYKLRRRAVAYITKQRENTVILR